MTSLVPPFQDFLLPTLRAHGDGTSISRPDAPNVVAAVMGLDEVAMAEMLPSGRRPRVVDRVGWARTYLRQAGLLEPAGRGLMRLSEKGKEYLEGSPSRLTIEDLRQFPEFVDFAERTRPRPPGGPSGPEPPDDGGATPEDRLASAAKELRQTLIEELLDQLKQVTPAAFEQLVLLVLQSMGYGGSHAEAARVLGKSGDGGVDGVIQEDRLGLDEIYVQAKRYTDAAIGPEVVRAFAGSLDEKGTTKGVLITTSDFTASSRAFVDNIRSKRISLIDGRRLAELMLDHGLGVVETARYTVQRIDTDFFGEL